MSRIVADWANERPPEGTLEHGGGGGCRSDGYGDVCGVRVLENVEQMEITWAGDHPSATADGTIEVRRRGVAVFKLVPELFPFFCSK